MLRKLYPILKETQPNNTNMDQSKSNWSIIAKQKEDYLQRHKFLKTLNFILSSSRYGVHQSP